MGNPPDRSALRQSTPRAIKYRTIGIFPWLQYQVMGVRDCAVGETFVRSSGSNPLSINEARAAWSSSSSSSSAAEGCIWAHQPRCCWDATVVADADAIPDEKEGDGTAVVEGRRENCSAWSFHTQPAVYAARIHTPTRSSRCCCEEAVDADNSEVITDPGDDGTVVVDIDDRRMMYRRTNSGTASIAMIVATAAANEAITD